MTKEEVIEKIDGFDDRLKSQKDKILSTLKECVKIKLLPSKEVDFRVSKVGGYPYLPVGDEYPIGKNGEPMEFLAQINFAQMPQLQDYPTAGILEFFIELDEYGWGLDYDNPLESGVRVIYYEDLTKKPQTSFEALDRIRDEDVSPISKDEFVMSFEKSFEVASLEDYASYIPLGDDKFEHYLGLDLMVDSDAELIDAYDKAFKCDGHKVGGYAFFTQQDPRFYENREYSELLFQLDSDDSADIMWGDGGIANFFIKPEDLKRRDFSKILYNWDCY